jgi:hypothetical protein
MPNRRRPLPVSYIVRLYRADPDRIDAVAGLVEDVDAGRTTTFHSGSELLQRINGAESQLPAGAGGAESDAAAMGTRTGVETSGAGQSSNIENQPKSRDTHERPS